MIYRVQFRKDGSVASCSEVESHLKDGGLIVYVEAPTRASAITKGKVRLRQWFNERTAQLRAAGRCPCGKITEAGKKTCLACRLLRAKNQQEIRRIKKLPNAEALLKTRAEARAAARRASLKAIAAKASPLGSAETVRLANANWDAKVTLKHPNERSLMRQVLRAYDRDPSTFRAWCVRMIGDELELSQEAQAAE